MSSAAERLAREVTKTRTHEEALAVAEGFMARKRREKRAKLPKPPVPGKSRDDRRGERIASRVALRALCDARAAGKCEVCGRSDLRLELDHLVSGSVRKEDPTAAIMACVDCHRAKHRNDLPTLRAYKEACLRLFLHAGFHEIDRRLKKAERIADR